MEEESPPRWGVPLPRQGTPRRGPAVDCTLTRGMRDSSARLGWKGALPRRSAEARESATVSSTWGRRRVAFVNMVVPIAAQMPPPCSSGRSRPQLRRGSVRSATAAGEHSHSEPLLPTDVVAYAARDGVTMLCAVDTVLSDGRLALTPLEAEPDTGLWVETEADRTAAALTAHPGDVLRIHTAQFMQRAVADRVSNPHGEHAESVWEIADVGDMPPAVLHALRHSMLLRTEQLCE